MKRPTVGFVGTGVMGEPMAAHLLDAGYPLVVFNRTRSRADSLVSRGARWASSAGEVAAASDIVITIVGYPHDVEECYLGEGGIIERAREGALLVDMTTSTPSLAVRIASAAAKRGLRALDAPVSGGDVGAREARLTIMVGGDEDAFKEAEPLFSAMGKTWTLAGGPGAGQHTKMANQIAIAGSMLGAVEAFAYARAAGLDLKTTLDAISAGAAGSFSMSTYVPRIISGDLAPGFYVKHFIKDLSIAIDEATGLGIDLPGLALATQLYERLAEKDGAELGTQALWLLYP
ncbi:MAG: NAD(P)-dependent oxidoreductase [Coriobacteriia bacterium]|nr:NAD(P)-dependent oxidoreductase [Coriobacteriia bacterium]